MTKEWEGVGKFDMILFPESFRVATFFAARQAGLKEYGLDMLEEVAKNEEEALRRIRASFAEGRSHLLSVADRQSFLKEGERQLVGVTIPYQALRIAWEHLNPGGEIRKSDSTSDIDIYTYLKLKEEFPGAEVLPAFTGAVTILSKQKTPSR